MASPRRVLVIVVMVAVAVAVEAVWLAPASLLGPAVARATGGVLQLYDGEGTIWHGQATAAAGTARIPLTWSVEFWPLWRGEARVRLAPPAGARLPTATIAVGTHAIAFDDVDLALPADAFTRALRTAAVAAIGGELSVKARALQLGPDANRGEAHIGWRAARITFVGSAAPLDLGDVRATLTANGPALSGPVANTGGDLAIRGQWTVRPREAMRLTLQLSPRRPAQAALVQALSAIGTPDGAGWRVDWTVPWR